MTRTIALLALAGTSFGALAGPQLEVIYTSIAGDPTESVPGRPGWTFRSNLTSLQTLAHSPSGSHWMFKAFADDGVTSTLDVMIVGSGTTGTTVLDETEVSPDALYGYDFFDSDCGVNDTGAYVVGARLDGPVSTLEECIITGPSHTIVVRQGDSAPGLTDLTVIGDETYGNSLNSVHLSETGTVGFRADNIDNVDSGFDNALYHGATALAQSGTGAATGETYGGFAALSGNTLSSSADFSSWIVEADIDPSPLNTVEAVVVDDSVVIADGDLIGDGAVDGIFAVKMTGEGTWLARGDWTDDDDWAVRDGTLILSSGMTIGCGSEVVGASIAALNGDDSGNWAAVCTTDNADPDRDQVMVWNRWTVICRESDPVDVDGNGAFDDDTFIGSFDANDMFIGNDGYVYFFCNLKDDGGANLRSAFLRLAAPCSGADLSAPFQLLDFFDVLAYLCLFDAGLAGADLAAPFGTLDFFDVLEYLSLFDAGCP